MKSGFLYIFFLLKTIYLNSKLDLVLHSSHNRTADDFCRQLLHLEYIVAGYIVPYND